MTTDAIAELRRRADDVRARVSCESFLARQGFALVRAASTPTTKKFKRGEDVVVTVRGGLGWFSPLVGGKEGRGDVIDLAEHLLQLDFKGALRELSAVAGLPDVLPSKHTPRPDDAEPTIDAPRIWRSRRAPWVGSEGWRYLSGTRRLSEQVLLQAVRAGVLREGIHGTVHGLHRDAAGAPCGWEMRGPNYKQFVKHGRKGLFLFAPSPAPTRLAVTEAFIDALSMADIENLRRDSAWASVDGGFGHRTEEALRAWLDQAAADTLVVVATDADKGGDLLGDRVAAIAAEMQRPWQRLLPPDGHNDWNLALQSMRSGPT